MKITFPSSHMAAAILEALRAYATVANWNPYAFKQVTRCQDQTQKQIGADYSTCRLSRPRKKVERTGAASSKSPV
ncbi:unnamed protein product [Schistosoma mattheei]|uniref:Uncharacterized protein n=1 Tax=Schistosoma mattheei TaxID=31246 RepID=A0A183PNN2_9TREM|nr:unnamed protein product [Schistosoma mattheei]